MGHKIVRHLVQHRKVLFVAGGVVQGGEGQDQAAELFRLALFAPCFRIEAHDGLETAPRRVEVGFVPAVNV